MRLPPASAGVVAALVLASAAHGAEAPSTVTISHDPIRCIVVNQFTRVTALLSPAEDVARGRVAFHARGQGYWYSVRLKPAAEGQAAILPKVKPGVDAVEYYLDVLDRRSGESRTADITAVVVDRAGECSRAVAAVLGAGESISVEAPPGAPAVPAGFLAEGLTTVAGSGPAVTETKSGGGHKGLLIAGAAVALGAGAAVAASGGGGGSSPSAPGGPAATPVTVTASPAGVALVAATVVTFNAAGGSGSCTWEFGDGGVGSGTTVTHVFPREGSFAVTAHCGASGSTTVSARSLTGRWLETTGADTHDLVQNGTALTGTFVTSGGLQVAISGTVSDPRRVVYERADCDRRWELTADDTLTRMTGTELHLQACGAIDPSRSQDPIALARQ